ncbi:MAG: phosphoenolpyruvate--protein phosphotransferase [Spirochaetales bacterium]|nr:phosphoenolpyruvate--protein phosphotransferase [Spirochaetales bacterium]MBR6200754.1 phosphoenolpyruvate--protein phosphotransferase [Spirochaetales bacterium]
MKEYTGIAASPGISIGEVLVYTQELYIPNFSISTLQVELEINRFYEALNKTQDDYKEMQRKLGLELTEDESKLFDAHILMTQDTTFFNNVVETIRETKKNIEYVLYNIIMDISAKFTQQDDEYFQDRALDIIDFGRNILRHLLQQKDFSLSQLDKDAVIISSDLTVSDTASMNRKHVMAFVTEKGGRTSHAAILANSLSIPAVLGIPLVTKEFKTGDKIIVDGDTGIVILNPDEETLNDYSRRKTEREENEKKLKTLLERSSDTLDGKHIALRANLEIPEQELDNLMEQRPEGIGLYRSEFLYLSRRKQSLPSEDQHFNTYKVILERIPEDKVVVRTLDVGGDKILEGVTEREPNPNLGWRAIRFCLDNKDIFKTQLRALYRASMYGNLHIMLPMISTIDELNETKQLIEDVKKELKKEGLAHKDRVPLGVMIETPAAVMISDTLAKNCDFFSIGSNDLIQYTLACDRANSRVSHLYQPLHPAVLQMIKITIDNAHKNGIPVSICGEMGASAENAAILIGLGIDELSVSPTNILKMKDFITNIKYSDAKKLADEVLTMPNQAKIQQRVEQWLKKHIR